MARQACRAADARPTTEEADMAIYSYFEDVSTQPGYLMRSTWSNGAWGTSERLTVGGSANPNLVDADVLQLANGTWLLTYRDTSSSTTLYTAVSQDGLNFTDARVAFSGISGGAPADPSVVRLLDGSYLMAISQVGTDWVSFYASADGRSYTATGVAVHANVFALGTEDDLVQNNDGTLRLFGASNHAVTDIVSFDGGRTWSAEAGGGLVDATQSPGAPSVFRLADGSWEMLFQEDRVFGSTNIVDNALQVATSSDGVHFSFTKHDAIAHVTGPEGIDTAALQRTYPTAGNDVFAGTAVNDYFNGQAGLDTAVMSGTRAQTTLTTTEGGITATGPGGTDTLVGIERVEFSDRGVAFDTLGSAGSAARIIGAAFGSTNMTPAFMGIGIRLFDGGISMHDAAQLALGTPLFLQLAGGHDDTSFVKEVFLNVVGRVPTFAEQSYYVGMLASGVSQADLLASAANSVFTADTIDLAGLGQTGIEYM
jgi:hypothetical protein